MRIKESDLKALVSRINKAFNIENKNYSTIGAFDLDYAYGGVQLVQYVNEFGGVNDVFRCGHITKKDLYNRMDAFLTGIEFCK